MIRTRKLLALLFAVLFLTAFTDCGNSKAFAESAPKPGPEESASLSDAHDSTPTSEDFTGEYTCTTIMFGKDTVPLQEEPYTLTIDGNEAVIVGISELGADPLTLQFDEGEMFWVPPGEGQRVFTLRLTDGGAVTLRFDAIPEAPVFVFDPLVPALEEFTGEYIGKTISIGEDTIPLDEKEYHTLTITGDEAVISEGIVTGTNGPGTVTIKLLYDNGELFWQPDSSDSRVFTLRMLKDGSVTITFETSPDIPVFHFDPVEPVS